MSADAQPDLASGHALLEGKPAGGYVLEISPSGCLISANDKEGAFNAQQTLLQLRRQFGVQIPAMEILDWPDYPTRGLYHDVTRGKVPTLATLKKLADYCASIKLNQLQLYIEHTFAYQTFTEVWEGSDPLTAEEIVEFDQYCADRHIDLVPSFTTFGHFYPFIRTKRFQHLNELERDVSEDAFNWLDRMAHYTLDCQNSESIELVRALITEVRPLFRSKLFNICADETMDIGKGKNKALADKLGRGRLYVDFVTQIIQIVRDVNAVPMMWGDIIAHHLELLGEIPEDVILLDWDYSVKLDRSIAKQLGESGRPFYVCSGTCGWNTLLPDGETATANIRGLADRGKQHGAIGYLVTDWGDYGHINTLAVSLPGIALAAGCAWNTATTKLPIEEVERLLSVAVLGDSTGRLATLLREGGNASLLEWRGFAWWQQGSSQDVAEGWCDSSYDEATGLATVFFAQTIESHQSAKRTLITLAQELENILANAQLPEVLSARELLFTLHAAIVFEDVEMALLTVADRNPDGLATVSISQVVLSLRALDKQWEAVWLSRNKRAEFDRIRDVLQGTIAFLEPHR